MKYKKTHTDKKVAKLHSDKIKKRKGIVNQKTIKNKIILEYTFPDKTLTVYHGTNSKHVNDIKKQLKSPTGYHSAGWYMVATDFESALFHATPEKNKDAIVFEFEVPLTNEKWFGYPYFWPAFERNKKSSWFALKKTLPKDFIKKIHKIKYKDWLKQKDLQY